MPHPYPPLVHRRGFTAEAKENIRKRYVETDEAMYRIAADVGVHRDTIARLAEAEGWPLRKDRPPRDLPVTLRLDIAAAEMRDAAAALTAAPVVAPPPEAADATEPAEPLPPSIPLPLADRLQQAVERELAKVERLKEETGSETRRTMAVERIARTLSALTQTLFKVRALREPGSVTADAPHDDLPADIDGFRDALARRIEAFVASRADADVPAAGEHPGAASPAA